MKDNGFCASTLGQILCIMGCFILIAPGEDARRWAATHRAPREHCWGTGINIAPPVSRATSAFQATLPENTTKGPTSVRHLSDKSCQMGNVRQVINLPKWCQAGGRHNSICNEVTGIAPLWNLPKSLWNQSASLEDGATGGVRVAEGRCFRRGAEAVGNSQERNSSRN